LGGEFRAEFTPNNVNRLAATGDVKLGSGFVAGLAIAL
jgi:hypothetical protein